MEPNQEIEDDSWAAGWQWKAIEDTIVLVGLLLFQASLFKSGYSAEVQVELMDRVNRMIREYARKGT